MAGNNYLYEKLTEAYRRDLLREAEQQRLVNQLVDQRRNLAQRVAYGLGVILVKLGMWLKQGEQSGEPAREQV